MGDKATTKKTVKEYYYYSCEISPTIFGAVFESTLNPETRRSGGMHYTSIENIHKVIAPLFFLLLYLLIYFLLLYVLHPLLVLYLDSLLDFHPLAICNILLCY